jgi:hypothetical protein
MVDISCWFALLLSIPSVWLLPANCSAVEYVPKKKIFYLLMNQHSFKSAPCSRQVGMKSVENELSYDENLRAHLGDHLAEITIPVQPGDNCFTALVFREQRVNAKCH